MRMMPGFRRSLGGIVALTVTASVAMADERGLQQKEGASPSGRAGPAGTSSGISAAPNSVPRLVYRPPSRGAPAARIGAATRGGAPQDVDLEVLAPDHVGLTTEEQPTLYWFNSALVRDQVQLTITAEDEIRPLLEIDLPRPMAAGIHAYSLAGTAIRLKPNAEYEWSVAIVRNPQERSEDMVASGVIKRVPAPAAIDTLGTGGAEQRAAIFAENGIWYDAVQVLNLAITDKPADSQPRQALASLLEQADLRGVASALRH